MNNEYDNEYYKNITILLKDHNGLPIPNKFLLTTEIYQTDKYSSNITDLIELEFKAEGYNINECYNSQIIWRIPVIKSNLCNFSEQLINWEDPELIYEINEIDESYFDEPSCEYNDAYMNRIKIY